MESRSADSFPITKWRLAGFSMSKFCSRPYETWNKVISNIFGEQNILQPMSPKHFWYCCWKHCLALLMKHSLSSSNIFLPYFEQPLTLYSWFWRYIQRFWGEKYKILKTLVNCYICCCFHKVSQHLWILNPDSFLCCH